MDFQKYCLIRNALLILLMFYVQSPLFASISAFFQAIIYVHMLISFLRWKYVWKRLTEFICNLNLHEQYYYNGDLEKVSRHINFVIAAITFTSSLQTEQICNEKQSSENLICKNILDLLLDKTVIRCSGDCCVNSLYDCGPMSEQRNRIATFIHRHHRNDTAPSSILLANNGFYFDPNSSTVRCCRCDQTLPDGSNDPRSCHAEDCDRRDYHGISYSESFRENQDMVIQERIRENRRQHRQSEIENGAVANEPQTSCRGTIGRSLPIRHLATASSKGNAEFRIRENRRQHRQSEIENGAVANEPQTPCQDIAGRSLPIRHLATASSEGNAEFRFPYQRVDTFIRQHHHSGTEINALTNEQPWLLESPLIHGATGRSLNSAVWDPTIVSSSENLANRIRENRRQHRQSEIENGAVAKNPQTPCRGTMGKSLPIRHLATASSEGNAEFRIRENRRQHRQSEIENGAVAKNPQTPCRGTMGKSLPIRHLATASSEGNAEFRIRENRRQHRQSEIENGAVAKNPQTPCRGTMGKSLPIRHLATASSEGNAEFRIRENRRQHRQSEIENGAVANEPQTPFRGTMGKSLPIRHLATASSEGNAEFRVTENELQRRYSENEVYANIPHRPSDMTLSQSAVDRILNSPVRGSAAVSGDGNTEFRVIENRQQRQHQSEIENETDETEQQMPHSVRLYDGAGRGSLNLSLNAANSSCDRNTLNRAKESKPRHRRRPRCGCSLM